MKFIKTKLVLFAAVFYICFPLNANALDIPVKCDPASKICNPIAQDNIQGFIKDILEGAIKIGIPIIALAVIYSGFLFVQAQGNPGELEKAKGALTWTLVGAAILLGAWAIAKLIADTILSL